MFSRLNISVSDFTDFSQGSFEYKLFQSFVLILIQTPSFIINSSFLLVIYKDPFKKFNTASTEILVCWFAWNIVFVLPGILTGILVLLSWPMPIIMIHILDCIHIVSYTLTGAFLTLVSVDNYILVALPLSYKAKISKRRVRVVIAVLFSLSFLLGICSVIFIFSEYILGSYTLYVMVVIFAVPVLQIMSLRALKRHREMLLEMQAEQRNAKEAFVKCQQQFLLGLRITFSFHIILFLSMVLMLFVVYTCPDCKLWLEILQITTAVGAYSPSLFKPLFLALGVSSYRNAFAEVYRRMKSKMYCN